MSWEVEQFTPADIAEAIADTDTYYIGLRELVIDAASYSKRDGSFILEGYVLDKEDNKHYVEAHVRVESVQVDETPYEFANEDEDLFAKDFGDEDEDED